MPALEVSTRNAVLAAVGNPAPVLARLRDEALAFLAQPAIQRRMAELSAKPRGGDVMARVAREYAETVVVVHTRRVSGYRPESMRAPSPHRQTGG